MEKISINDVQILIRLQSQDTLKIPFVPTMFSYDITNKMSEEFVRTLKLIDSTSQCPIKMHLNLMRNATSRKGQSVCHSNERLIE